MGDRAGATGAAARLPMAFEVDHLRIRAFGPGAAGRGASPSTLEGKVRPAGPVIALAGGVGDRDDGVGAVRVGPAQDPPAPPALVAPDPTGAAVAFVVTSPVVPEPSRDRAGIAP